MNIKQRALELLQDESLRGRVPREVQDLLREVAALEPVKWRVRIGASDIWGTTNAEWEADFYGKQSGCSYEKNPLYTLTGATHD